jgi:hypothetical protein
MVQLSFCTFKHFNHEGLEIEIDFNLLAPRVARTLERLLPLCADGFVT